MTESVVALGHGSPGNGMQRPRASARARMKASVTRRDRLRRIRAANPAAKIRHIGRVMYLDAADSWIVNTHSPAPKTVWRTDYNSAVPGAYRPFTTWCRIYRYPAVVFGATLDGAKWLLIHPLRGPLTITAAAAGAATILT